ncbi:unnamed protein product [Rotaria magnacalcarata]|uniref:Uncharacterized protein n=1 Tax=Rotaria magnacalcarata TaxID=392030 RepID=A0A816USA4_9BILA|nr:unnamed protein product [Rotaria magnacalcarata]
METFKGKPLFEHQGYLYTVNKNQMTNSLTTHTIVSDAVSKLSDNAISSLPNLRNLKRNVRKIRQRSQNPLSLPTTRDSIVIDPQYTRTARNRTFLHFASGSIDQRILIVSTKKKQLKILENANYIYLDGTFSVVPELYFQLYTIHATYLSHIVPIVYILLRGKHDLVNLVILPLMFLCLI